MLREILEEVTKGVIGKPLSYTVIMKQLKDEENFNKEYIEKAFDVNNYILTTDKGWQEYLFPNEKNPYDEISMYYSSQSKYNTLKNKVKKIKQQLLDKLEGTKTNTKFEYLTQIEKKIKKEIKQYCDVMDNDRYYTFKDFKITKTKLVNELINYATNDIIKYIEKNYDQSEYENIYNNLSKIDSSIYIKHDEYTQVYGHMNGWIYGRVSCDSLDFDKTYTLATI